MSGLNYSLNRKFIAGTAAGLLISFVIFIALYLNQYQHQLSTERAQAASQVNNLLQASLENAMLKRDLDGLSKIVNQLGQQDSVTRVFITNPKGEIRFSSARQLLGKIHAPDLVQIKNPNPVSLFTTDHQGNEVLRSINPVHNQQICVQCHGPQEKNPVNGILYVDFDALSLRQSARNTTLLLMGSGALIVLINLMGGWWFIKKFVLKPVDALSDTSTQLMQGNLDARANLEGHDELGQLGHTLDQMAENLQSKIKELEHQQSFLQSLVDAIPDGIRIIDQQNRLLLTNKAYQEQVDDTESHVGKTCFHSSHQEERPCAPTLTTCPVYEINQSDQPVKALHQHKRKDGLPFEVEIYAAPMQATLQGTKQKLIVESIRDLEKSVKYSQEQKLSELGRLAAGVAHEIHNPLTSVRLALDASTRSLEQSEASKETAEYLSLVDKEIDKCIEVTQRLLKLSAPPPANKEIIEINSILSDTISLLEWEAEIDHIEIVQIFESGLRLLATDSEMRMVALNIIQNAFHAMPEGGRLEIQSQREGPRILVSFKDTGVGISKDDLERIFDPFFSRRADHKKGTGLGLSITRNIVEGFDGHIIVESEKGKGSTFTLSFPDPDSKAGAQE